MNTKIAKIASAVALACAMGNTAYANTTAEHNKEVIGYITNWDPWKDTNAGFAAKGVANHLNVDMSKFTILNYSFFGVAVDGSLHSGDHRNKNIYKEGEVQQPKEILMSDIYSSWDYHLVFGELKPSYTLTDEAKEQGFTAEGSTWKHEGYGLSGAFPIPVKKTGGKPGILDHAHNNGVKVMASIGGWSMCKHFPEMAADPVKRAKFMADVKRLIAMGFDGIDLDWEYPGPYSGMNFTGSEADYGNFLTLVKEIRQAIGPDKLITAAFSADINKLEGFDWPELDKYMDHYNMMTYDFNGGWSGVAGHNAPMSDYPGSEIPRFNWDTVGQWMIDKGIRRSKINMGIPFYGRGVVTEAPADIAAPTIKQDIVIQPDGPISSAADYDHWKKDVYNGTPNYFFVEQNRAGWEKKYDEAAQVPYLTKSANGKNYVLSYDDVDSVAKKAQYIADHNLGGTIVWTVAGDLECTGGVTVHSGKLAECGNVNQPLANKINEVFAKGGAGNPNAAFTAPRNGDNFLPGSNIEVKVHATDPDGQVSSVEFFANGASIGLDSSYPYELVWTNVQAGNYVLSAVATDNEGKTGEAVKVNVAVNDDVLKPEVVYTGPAGDIVMDPLGNVTVTATATSNASRLTSVDFTINGQLLQGSNTTGNTYSATYTPADYGQHDVTVVASNEAGFSDSAMGSFNLTKCDALAWDPNKVYTNEKVVYENKMYQSKWWNKNQRPDTGQAWQYLKDCGPGVPPANKPPVLSNLLPDNGVFDTGTDVKLSVTASDTDGTVQSVAFYINDELLSTDTTAPYEATFNTDRAGTVALRAVATDDDQDTAEVAGRFTLQHPDQDTPPVVTITTPGNGQELDLGSVVNIAADVTDDSAVTEVEFQLDGAVLGKPSGPDYSVQWTAERVGNYTLVVTAYDDTGNKTVETISFSVVDNNAVCSADAWQSGKVYVAGDRASVSGQVYEAKWWTQGEDPTKSGQWGVWFIPDDCQ